MPRAIGYAPFRPAGIELRNECFENVDVSWRTPTAPVLSFVIRSAIRSEEKPGTLTGRAKSAGQSSPGVHWRVSPDSNRGGTLGLRAGSREFLNVLNSGKSVMKTTMIYCKSPLCPIALISAALFSTPVLAEESVDAYLDLELEDQLSMEVTSVSRKKQRLNEVAAAAYVITQDDIRRSGVTSIPEALRLAPGIQVTKMDCNKWAISSRGFNAQFANNLLVLIDGRSVYTSTYSGVYWEVQDTMLEDIDRIEVIRGPGATVWGANAVNGVINIITKQASETQGGLLVAGAGNEEKALTSLRYGAELGEQTFGRIYLKYNDRDSSFAPLLDEQAGDDWNSLRAGFRVDGVLNVSSQWTLQGDIYETDENQIVHNIYRDPTDPANNPPYSDSNVADNIEASGWNLLGRWEQRLSEGSSATLQVYFDHNERKEAVLEQRNDTLDIDFQQQFSSLEGHDIVWGLGYRRIQDDFGNTFSVSLSPEEQTSDLFSTFVQDEIELTPETLRLTLGSKFEHNDYTGFEVQPSARLLWLPKEGHTLWSSVSRAVRTPSRVEDSVSIVTRIIPIGPPPTPPMILTVNGDEDFEAEELTSIERKRQRIRTLAAIVTLCLLHVPWQQSFNLFQRIGRRDVLQYMM
ncbi:MAG: outer membrane receptor protein [endosymbiont of Seepiophila jonesi]|uniref:Outer membrane receptor protein n=1 Tax=endosymbiont of Lamellibrachia luymesi TaxID=2200907 RepID=A0A370DJY4_9GAMM|nr:MAG: outer membrane receptor protein [endosymbiont of Lamellibrachia luymesi]RDH93055.1 MAG: outer membrane receptor protein [endosymbiont of Seepiophila jonesi]